MKEINKITLQDLKQGKNKQVELDYDITIMYGNILQEGYGFIVLKTNDYDFKVIRIFGENEIEFCIHYVNTYLLRSEDMFKNMVRELNYIELLNKEYKETKKKYDKDLSLERDNIYDIIIQQLSNCKMIRKSIKMEFNNLLKLGFEGDSKSIERLKSL